MGVYSSVMDFKSAWWEVISLRESTFSSKALVVCWRNYFLLFLKQCHKGLTESRPSHINVSWRFYLEYWALQGRPPHPHRTRYLWNTQWWRSMDHFQLFSSNHFLIFDPKVKPLIFIRNLALLRPAEGSVRAAQSMALVEKANSFMRRPLRPLPGVMLPSPASALSRYSVLPGHCDPGLAATDMVCSRSFMAEGEEHDTVAWTEENIKKKMYILEMWWFMFVKENLQIKLVIKKSTINRLVQYTAMEPNTHTYSIYE